MNSDNSPKSNPFDRELPKPAKYTDVSEKKLLEPTIADKFLKKAKKAKKPKFTFIDPIDESKIEKKIEKKIKKKNEPTMAKMEEKIKEKTFEPVFVADEDVKIRTFLKNIKDEKDTEIILEKIIYFMNMENALKKRKNVFQSMIDTLGPKKLKSMINEYLNQYDLDFYIFYKNYVENIGVEEKKIKNFFEDLFYEEDTTGRKKLIENYSKIAEKLIKFRDSSQRSIETKEIIQKIFTSLDYFLLRKFSNEYVKQYMDLGNKIPSLEEIYENFMSKPATLRYLEENNIKAAKSAKTTTGKPSQLAPLKQISKKILDILKSGVTDEIKNLGKEKLFESIISVSPYKSEYEDAKQYLRLENAEYKLVEYKEKIMIKMFKDPNYISNIIDEIDKYVENSSSSVEEFAKILGEIIIYILPIENVNNDMFVKKLLSGYYLPSVLYNLSAIEKLPEVFENDYVSHDIKKEVANNLHILLDQFIRNFANDIYITKNLYTLKNIPRPKYSQIAKFPKIKSCENSEDVINILPNDIIRYVDTGKIYCFSIKNIVENNLIINKYTGKHFTKEFIKIVNETYKISDVKNKKNVTENVVELAPGLLEYIEKDLGLIRENIFDLFSNYENEKIMKFNYVLKKKSDKEEEDVEEDTYEEKDTEEDDTTEEEDTDQEEDTYEEDSYEEKDVEEDDDIDVKENLVDKIKVMDLDKGENNLDIEENGKDEDTDEDDDTDDDVDDDTDDDTDNDTDNDTDEDEEDTDDDNVEDLENKKDNIDELGKEIEETKISDDYHKKCQKCKNSIKDEDKALKTFIFKNKKEKKIYFCCFKCFEEYKFPKIKL